MGKILLWVVVALLAWAGWRLWTISARRAQRARDAASAATRAEGGKTASRRVGAPETMVQCAVCGVHLPGSEARFAGGRVFCSDDHRRLGTADTPRSDGS